VLLGPAGASASIGGHYDMMTTPAAVLEARGLTKRFGGLAAVRDVSFAIRSGRF